ncbi:(2Fe-2S)-binding protein [Kitasatospora viridis]|uniref:FhuF-like iron-sulfur protein n=1 Tax=Kitasatospora viridis TaxID=281105 RepID=A0A561TT00_9ACTN|nr:(2Fe-2S)-binding protein [Kitasatospora viridis]TWF90232.1 FhuF-like iron-sulfur protein [Kitasatospora viridis]
MVATLAQVAALGPFFACETHGDGPPAAPWYPMGQLLDDPGVLAARVAATREHLARVNGRPVEAVEPRVAASVTQLGLTARLLSPAFGLAVLGGAVLPYGLRDLHWQPEQPGGIVPLSLPGRAPEPVGGPAELADRVAAELRDGAVRELVELAGAHSLSARVRWGNVASAVHGAAAAIAWSAPHLAPRARQFTALLLDRTPLRGTGALTARGFRRRSCCLIYRAAPDGAGALCGDCVLAGVRSSGT